MDDRIIDNLLKLFEKHRIIFWYDDEKELREEFENLSIDGIEKLEIANNEYAIKHKILREYKNKKFLLYHEGDKPEPEKNWLLDVLLSHTEFKVDQVSIIASELDLDISFINVVRAHRFFFNSKQRVADLKSLLNSSETKDEFRLKMLAACSKTDIATIDSVLLHLIDDIVEENPKSYKLIENSNLKEYLWGKVCDIYGYNSSNPSIIDFVHEIFKDCFNLDTNEKIKLNPEVRIFLKGWSNSILHAKSFRYFAEICENGLDIKTIVDSKDFRNLIGIDYFEYIDRYIIKNLIFEILERTITYETIEDYMRKQRVGFWYNDYKHLYEALRYASWFLKTVDEVNLTIHTLSDGVNQYIQSWFLVDQLYRKYIYHVRESGQLGMMEKLSSKVENRYSNKFLLKLNDRWQNLVDQLDDWKIIGYIEQSNFYKFKILPYVSKGQKICVIISDAMRFEIGEELTRVIRAENGLTSIIEPMISSVPSYTQLGMASLLPNEKLSIKDDAYVLVDGKSSQGTINRDKILKSAINDKAMAINSKKITNMKTDELKTLIRDNSIMYIYHDVIDSTGGNSNSTERVSAAAEQTIIELTTLTKKLTNCNVRNLIITADHGFIYQDREIDESDYIGNKLEGDGIIYSDRRMVLGRNLLSNSSLKHFSSSQLGLEGDLEVQIAKSINRLRKSGSVSKFVHGGTSVQEVIIPVISINKNSQKDVAKVDIEIYIGGTNVITTGQLAINFYQKQPISDKMQSRTLKVGLYTKDNMAISEEKEFIFDYSSENPRERELIESFILSSKANEMKKQNVYLRLYELIDGTNQQKLYREITYLLNRQMTTDFDL